MKTLYIKLHNRRLFKLIVVLYSEKGFISD